MSTDFSSIDRLVEFGMGISLAQQMVNTMNHTMDSMKVAGVNAGTIASQASSCKSARWYVVVDNRQAGPLSDEEMNHLVKEHKIAGDTLVWTPGLAAWKLAGDIPEINKLFLLNS